MRGSMFRLTFYYYFLVLAVIFIPSMATSEVYQLRVDGIVCPFCGYGIEKELKSFKGVEDVDLDVSKGIITVTTSKGTKLTESNMRKVISNAGFTLSGFKEIEEEEKSQDE